MSDKKERYRGKFFNTKSINWIIFMIVSSAILIQGMIWLLDSIYLLKSDIEEVKQIQTDYIKAELKERVAAVIDYSDYRSQEIEKVLKNELLSRTYEAYAVMTNIYESNKDHKSKEAITQLIKDALREIRFNDGRGYFFVDSLEGDVILYPVYPNTENTNLINLQDEKGDYVMQEEIKLVKSEGEGYIEGFWKNPNAEDDKPYKKITFVKAFEPYGWYLGCGDYLDEITKEIQREVLAYVDSIQYGEDDAQYVFLHDYDGIELANGVYPEIVGQNNYHLEDINGAKVYQEQIKICKQENGGYLTHYWPTTDGKSYYKKLTYVAPLSKWEWVIGTGMDVSEIDALIAMKERELKIFIWQRISVILLVLGCLMMVSRFYIKRFMMTMEKNFSIFKAHMLSAEKNLLPIDVKDLDYSAFSDLAEVTNSMTERINQLLQFDELTGVYNRRYFKENFDKVFDEFPNSTGMILIDIDYFKRVNDNYGHDVGDDSLVSVARIISNSLSGHGFVARFGGEEFVVVLKNHSLGESIELAETIRKNIEGYYIEPIQGHVTVSCGVSHSQDWEKDAMLKQADTKLYLAKALGRNRSEY